MALVKWNLDNLKDFKIIKESSYKFDPGVKKDIDILIALQKASLEDLSNLNFKYIITINIYITFINTNEVIIDIMESFS